MIDARDDVVEFHAVGHPVPKGSMRVSVASHAGTRRDGSAGSKLHVIPSNSSRLARWCRALRDACARAIEARTQTWELSPSEMYALHTEFYFARPRSHYRSSGELRDDAPERPQNRANGDLDKLQRAVFDAINGKAYPDDSQIVEVVASKHWSEKGVEGARVVVRRI